MGWTKVAAALSRLPGGGLSARRVTSGMLAVAALGCMAGCAGQRVSAMSPVASPTASPSVAVSHARRLPRFVPVARAAHVRVFAPPPGYLGRSCPPRPVPVSGAQVAEAGKVVLAALPKLFSPRAYPRVNFTAAYVKLRILASAKTFPYEAATGCGRAVLHATVFVLVVLPHEKNVSASTAHEWFYVALVKGGWAIWGSYS